MKHCWEKIPNWECLFIHREKGLFLSVYVDDIKLAGKERNIDPMWKLLDKDVALGEPTFFLDQECVDRYCELANKTTQQVYKISTPCIDDHHFKEEMKSVENCQLLALKLF